MGFLKKAKEAAQQAQQAFAPEGKVAADDPIWQPINGVSLQDYADLAREAQTRGTDDEAGMMTLAQERGWNPVNTKAALDGWVHRMGQSVAVGQQFRKFLGY